MFVVGGLVAIFAQPYFPPDWTNWIGSQQTRVDRVVEAVNTEADVADKARAAVEMIVPNP